MGKVPSNIYLILRDLVILEASNLKKKPDVNMASTALATAALGCAGAADRRHCGSDLLNQYLRRCRRKTMLYS